MIPSPSKPFKIAAAASFACLAIYIGFRYHVSQELASEFAALERSGAPVTLDQLNAAYPTPIEADNAAKPFQEVFANLGPADFTGASTAFFGHLMKDALEGPAGVDALRQSQRHLATYPARIRGIRAATDMPSCRFPIDYRNCLSGESDVAHLAGLTYAARILQTQILINLEDNKPAEAIENFGRVLQLSRALDQEPSFSAYYVRMTILSTLASVTNRIVNRAELTPATLKRLATAFNERLIASDLQHALDGERCLGSIRFLAPLGREQALLTDASAASPLFTLPLYGDHLDLRMLYYLRSFQAFKTASIPFGNNRLQGTSAITVANASLPTLQYVHDCQAQLTASIQVAVLGLLVVAKKAEKGDYPQTLAPPAHLAMQPPDPFGDGTHGYGYSLGSEEIRIYSVGRDGVDNGGSETFFIEGLADFRYGDLTFIKKRRNNY